MIQSDRELQMSRVLKLHIGRFISQNRQQLGVVSKHLRRRHNAIVFPCDKMNRHVELIVEIGEPHRLSLPIPQLVPLSRVVERGERIAIVPLPKLQHHVQRRNSQRILRVVHLLERPVARFPADHQRADLVDELQRGGRGLHVLQELRDEEMDAGGARGERAGRRALGEEQRGHAVQETDHPGLVGEEPGGGEQNDVGEVMGGVGEVGESDVGERDGAAHGVRDRVERVELVEPRLVEISIFGVHDFALKLHRIVASNASLRVLTSDPLLLLDHINAFEERAVVQREIVDVVVPIRRVRHVQHLVPLPIARVMPVRPSETPEKNVEALEIGLDRERQRGLVGDPGERGVHHSVLEIDDLPRLGARNAEENETVAIDGVDGVLLERVAEQRLGEERGGEGFLAFHGRRAHIGSGRDAFVEDRGRTIGLQRP